MGSHKKKGATYRETVPIPDYNATGECSPDVTCNYYEEGTYSGKPYYKRVGDSGTFYLFWFNIAQVWIISDALGQVTNCFSSDGTEIEHTYIPVGTYEGNPVVSAGGH